jgi:hypothetical protein
MSTFGTLLVRLILGNQLALMLAIERTQTDPWKRWEELRVHNEREVQGRK